MPAAFARPACEPGSPPRVAPSGRGSLPCRAPRQQGVRAGWAGAALLMAFGSTPSVRAEGWGGGVGVTSNKVYRGLATGDGHPSLLADVYYQTDTGWSAGVGATSLRHDGSTNGEFTVRAGRTWQIDADWTAQLGGERYDTTGSGPVGALDYSEFSAAAGWRGRFFATLAWSPDTLARASGGAFRKGHAVTLEAVWHQPLVDRLALDVGVGHVELQGSAAHGYAYGHVGLGWALGAATVYLQWIDSQAESRGIAPAPVGGPHRVATLLWTF